MNFEFNNEATRANLQENKRILKWRPFWKKVYSAEYWLFGNDNVYDNDQKGHKVR